MYIILRILLGLPGFALGIMIHESAHAFVALKLGDPTGRNMGRISLDPRRHLDPIGAIFYIATMVMTGGQRALGWAKPVHINPFNFRDARRDFMLSSLAGPAANFVQAAVWAVLLRGYGAIALSVAEPYRGYIGYVFFFGILINVVLAIFNLIPIPPLDGSRVLAWMLPERLAQYLDRLEHAGIGQLIIFAVIFFVPGVLGAVLGPALNPIMEFFFRIAGGG